MSLPRAKRFKTALASALTIQPDEIIDVDAEKPPKFPYRRPPFLELDSETLAVYADHKMRPIVHPNFAALPYNAGYAECINAGKSRHNEDQAVCQQGVLLCSYGDREEFVPYTYYGLFDGHGGTGAALTAANQLHHLVQDKLVDAQDNLIRIEKEVKAEDGEEEKLVDTLYVDEDLVKGALEAAFIVMDEVIAADRARYAPAGGCTALVMLIVLDKVYIANAGDSRAILYNGGEIVKLSNDFSPEFDKRRILSIVQERPHLLNYNYTHIEYQKNIRQEDLGKTIIYKTPVMTGWAFKTATHEDLKHPVIQGRGRRSRILGVLAVARGFGDYDLMGHHRQPIKPFLSCIPEIYTYSLSKVCENSFVVMGTDGLWDVVDNTQAAQAVLDTKNNFPENRRYLCAATCLVAEARGRNNGKNYWFTSNKKHASMDDISLFVVPLHEHKLALDKKIEFLLNP